MVVVPLLGSDAVPGGTAVGPDIHARAALPAESTYARQAPKLEIGRNSSNPVKKVKHHYRC